MISRADLAYRAGRITGLVRDHGAGVAGPCLVVAGVWQWSPPAALIVAGLALWSWDILGGLQARAAAAVGGRQ